MKKTTKNIKQRKNLILLVVFAVMLAGCSSAKKEEVKEELTTTMQVEVLNEKSESGTYNFIITTP